jgi:hypothetical protein
MTFVNTLLRKLAEWHPAKRQTFQATDEASGWAVALTADRCDSLSCQLWEVTLQRPTPAEKPDLKVWAGLCAEQLRGLPGVIKVLEVDTLRQEALLRSEKPTEREDHVLYFEARLAGTNALTVRRFQASTQTPAKREQVAFVLSHEMIAGLVESFTISKS